MFRLAQKGFQVNGAGVAADHKALSGPYGELTQHLRKIQNRGVTMRLDRNACGAQITPR